MHPNAEFSVLTSSSSRSVKKRSFYLHKCLPIYTASCLLNDEIFMHLCFWSLAYIYWGLMSLLLLFIRPKIEWVSEEGELRPFVINHWISSYMCSFKYKKMKFLKWQQQLGLLNFHFTASSDSRQQQRWRWKQERIFFLAAKMHVFDSW